MHTSFQSLYHTWVGRGFSDSIGSLVSRWLKIQSIAFSTLKVAGPIRDLFNAVIRSSKSLQSKIVVRKNSSFFGWSYRTAFFILPVSSLSWESITLAFSGFCSLNISKVKARSLEGWDLAPGVARSSFTLATTSGRTESCGILFVVGPVLFGRVGLSLTVIENKSVSIQNLT